MDIGCIVPLISELFRHRHTAAKTQIAAGSPVTKIWESNNTLAADAEHFVEHQMGVAHDLQRLGHYHTIKRIVGKIVQARVDVLLNHIETLGDTGVDGCRVNF